MIKRLQCFFVMLIVCGFASAQTMPSTAPGYNQPYDTLIAQGIKGLNAGKVLGVKAPTLALMNFNRAIEINKDRYEAYLWKGNAYMDYQMVEEAIESFNTCLELSPNNPEALYGVFYCSFLGSRKYQLEEVPKPMMNQIYTSAVAFLKAAPEGKLAQEKANARLLGYTFKLAMDNKELFGRYMANNVDQPSDQNIQVIQEILPQVKATDNPPIVAGLLDKLVKYHLQRKEYAKVKSYGAEGVATGVGYTETYYNLAHTLYYQDNNVNEALSVIEAGLKHGPYSRSSALKLDIYATEGKKAFFAKDYAKASTMLNKFVSEDATNERVNAILGFSLYSLKKYAEAAKLLKKVKESGEPKTLSIYYPNLDAVIAFCAKPGTTPPVVQCAIQEVEKYEAMVQKGQDLYDEKKYDESSIAYQEPLAYFIKTNNPVQTAFVYTQLGYNFQNQQKYDDAKVHYQKAIAAGGDPGAYENYGLLLYALDKNYSEAERVLAEGLSKFESNYYLQNQMSAMFTERGNNMMGEKKYSDAVGFYEKATEYNENNARAYVGLGFCYYFLEQDQKSLDALDTAVFLQPNITDQFPGINQVFAALRK